ncbi:MAG: addiction module protein [Planctomycetota bacterium]|nr:addiction module protein [Planctomycetota bacterium]
MSPEPRSAADFQQITDHALLLPIDQRVELAQRLWDSVDAPVDPAYEADVLAIAGRRLQELQNGTANEVSHEDVMESTRKIIECE